MDYNTGRLLSYNDITLACHRAVIGSRSTIKTSVRRKAFLFALKEVAIFSFIKDGTEHLSMYQSYNEEFAEIRFRGESDDLDDGFNKSGNADLEVLAWFVMADGLPKLEEAIHLHLSHTLSNPNIIADNVSHIPHITAALKGREDEFALIAASYDDSFDVVAAIPFIKAGIYSREVIERALVEQVDAELIKTVTD